MCVDLTCTEAKRKRSYFSLFCIWNPQHFIEEELVVLWLSLIQINAVTHVQIMNEAVCISDIADNLRKGMNPIMNPKID